MHESDAVSLFTIYGPQTDGFCGYCKKRSNNKCIWGTKAIQLTAFDYQYLIDRGWRRSGSFCYKPLNDKTCCPCYTIRCDVTTYRLSRSHKRILRNMSHFLKCGELPSKRMSNMIPKPYQQIKETPLCSDSVQILPNGDVASPVADDILTKMRSPPTDYLNDKNVLSEHVANSPMLLSTEVNNVGNSVCDNSNMKHVNVGKARYRRWEEKQKRLMQRCVKESTSYEKLLQDYHSRRARRLDENRPKCLEDYLKLEPTKDEGKHYLEIRIFSTSNTSREFHNTLSATHKLYQRYQITVHQDEEDECDMEQLKRFLVSTPIIEEKHNNHTALPFGSYHQQYWLDGEQLIAVAAFDLLPKCLSSIYVFYDPNYQFLHLGTYTALRELAFVRHLYRSFGPESVSPDQDFINLHYYYMGYFIRSCPKMSYKAQYGPADLACPETYNWYPVSHCLQTLDASPNGKYARFSDTSTLDRNALCASMSADELSSQLLVRLKPRNKSTTTTPVLITLKQIQPYLNEDAITIIHEWARFIGQRAITGDIQISMIG